MLACPCCQHLTLSQRGAYDICPVCYWQDDPIDEWAPDDPSWANGGITTAQGRENFLAIGACRQEHVPHVRAANPDEIP